MEMGTVSVLIWLMVIGVLLVACGSLHMVRHQLKDKKQKKR